MSTKGAAPTASFLADGAMEVVGRIRWASNATLLVRILHDDLEGLAIYKPARGERPLWDFPDGDLHRRERAAYLVSEALGWGLVPMTILRDGPFGTGSVQLFVEHDPDVTGFDLLEAGHPAMRLVAAFDVVINNADRKAGHCLAGPGNQLWAIDHGVSFHREGKLRTVVWDFAGEPVGTEVIEGLERLLGALAEGDLGEELARLLHQGEIAALRRRTRSLAARGVFPRPTSERCFPWPLV